MLRTGNLWRWCHGIGAGPREVRLRIEPETADRVVETGRSADATHRSARVTNRPRPPTRHQPTAGRSTRGWTATTACGPGNRSAATMRSRESAIKRSTRGLTSTSVPPAGSLNHRLQGRRELAVERSTRESSGHRPSLAADQPASAAPRERVDRRRVDSANETTKGPHEIGTGRRGAAGRPSSVARPREAWRHRLRGTNRLSGLVWGVRARSWPLPLWQPCRHSPCCPGPRPRRPRQARPNPPPRWCPRPCTGSCR